MHWADFRAQRLSERDVPQVIVSGITPSGEFHIGHLREILTAEMIHRACLDACLLYTSPSPRDVEESRMPSSA